MSSSPPEPPKPDSLGKLTPEQERQLQHWQRFATPRSSRRSGVSWRLVAWGLGLWAGLLLLALAAFVLLSHPGYVGGRASQPRDRPSAWMGVVIVVSCVGGSLVLGRWLEIQQRR
mgnify:CR=1 FL=1